VQVACCRRSLCSPFLLGQYLLDTGRESWGLRVMWMEIDLTGGDWHLQIFYLRPEERKQMNFGYRYSNFPRLGVPC